MVKKDQKEEKELICKYFGLQAISELLGKKEENFQSTIQKGMEFEGDGCDFCSKINRFINVVRQNREENERLIKRLFNEISRRIPASASKLMNLQFIKQIGSNSDSNSNENEIKTGLSEEDDLK